MKMKLVFTILIATLYSFSSVGQRYTQAGQVHTFIQTSTKEGVSINGSSSETKIDYSQGGNQMVINLDLITLKTDNIEFNQQLENAFLGPLEVIAEVDASKFEYQSKYNEVIESNAVARLNNEESNILIRIIVTNKKTINTNTYNITGTGILKLSDHKLEDKFPMLSDEIKFEFTQSLKSTFR